MGDGPQHEKPAGSQRQKRLAEALKENLRRRKAQQRQRSAASEPPEDPPSERRDDGT